MSNNNDYLRHIFVSSAHKWDNPEDIFIWYNFILVNICLNSGRHAEGFVAVMN